MQILKNRQKIIIPRDIIQQIESLPEKKSNIKIIWQPWEDEILMLYGGKKSLRGIAKILGKKNTAIIERYKKLKEKKIEAI